LGLSFATTVAAEMWW